MRVLIELDSNDVRMGAVNDALDLARYGRSAKLEVLLCGTVSGPLLDAARSSAIGVVPVRSIPLSKREPLAYLMAVGRALVQLLKSRPDVVHINYVSWGPSLACAARLLGIPVVARAGGEYHPKNMSCRWTQRYLANCEAQALTLLNSPLAEKVRVVGDLINAARLEGLGRTKLLAPRKPATVRLVFLGQLVERKGIDVLIEAARLLDVDFELYLVGGDWHSEGYPQLLKKMISQYSLEDRIITLNHRDDALCLVDECDIFVLPSRSEARPRSIIEAMLLGKCVVASDVGGIPTLIADGRTGLLAPVGDAPALANCLRSVIADPGRREEISAAAKRYADGEFNMHHTVARYSRVYDEVAGRAAAPPASRGGAGGRP